MLPPPEFFYSCVPGHTKRRTNKGSAEQALVRLGLQDGTTQLVNHSPAFCIVTPKNLSRLCNLFGFIGPHVVLVPPAMIQTALCRDALAVGRWLWPGSDEEARFTMKKVQGGTGWSGLRTFNSRG